MTTRRRVEIGGAELCLESFGDPGDPSLLLVSGAAAAMDWWDTELCLRLAAGGRHVVRYDHRDTGESTTSPPGHPAYDGTRLSRDCLALVELLDAGPAHLVGVSMGGAIAQDVALRRPDLVASLTLVATTPIGGVPGDLPGPGEEVAAAFASPPPEPDWSDPTAYADWVVATNRPFAGRLGLDESRVRAIAGQVHARSHDPAAAGNHWLVAGDGDVDAAPPDVRRITAPTLVVHGSDDPMFPLPHGEALAAAVPGATLLVVPGMGHEVPPPPTWDVVVPSLLGHTSVRTRR